MDSTTVAATSYVNGVLHVQPKPMGGADASSAQGIASHPFGFAGRPKDPDVDSTGAITKGAVLFYWYEGNTVHSMPAGDPRRSAKLPTLDKGGSVQYADCDNAYGLFAADGTYTLRVPAGKTASIGDANAAALTYAQAFQNLCDALKTVLATNCVNGSPLTGATVFLNAIDAIKAAGPTTMIKGT